MAEPRPPATTEPFAERALETKLDFVQWNGMTGEYFMAEVTGSGGALIDFDDDGDLDVYFVQGALLGPGKTSADAIFQARYKEPVSDRLYRNELVEKGELTFTDVTAGSGLDMLSDYGMAAATGDFDNDGDPDLYITNFGPNRLLRNDGGGSFTDVTTASGTGDERWSVAAVFLDYDRDGWLDLFVGNYIAENMVHRQICRDFVGDLDYCGPGSFPPEPDRLFRNLGPDAGGMVVFEDVTDKAGLRGGFGAALGVIAADLNGDRLVDLYVANDSQPNNLWIQQADGTFVDEALLAGASVNGRGKAEASMGIAAADHDGDGDLDLFLAHLTGETNTLYVNRGNGFFADGTIASGLGAPSRPFTSFGTGWLDYDNDGWLDLLIVNGAVKKIEALARRNDPFPIHQPNQLFRNRGGGAGFDDVTASAGEVFELSEVSRGALFGDLDNDGDTDVVVVNNSGPARLLLNQVGHRRPWLGLRLVGQVPSGATRDLLGAEITVERAGLPPIRRRVHTDGSFCSANDPRVLVGLGEAPAVERVRVWWPDGTEEQWIAVETGGYQVLRQGSGAPVE